MHSIRAKARAKRCTGTEPRPQLIKAVKLDTRVTYSRMIYLSIVQYSRVESRIVVH